jgi:hypothetical protein
MKYKTKDVVILKTLRELKKEFFVVWKNDNICIYKSPLDSSLDPLCRTPDFIIHSMMAISLGKKRINNSFTYYPEDSFYMLDGYSWPIRFINVDKTEFSRALREVREEIGLK